MDCTFRSNKTVLFCWGIGIGALYGGGGFTFLRKRIQYKKKNQVGQNITNVGFHGKPLIFFIFVT